MCNPIPSRSRSQILHDAGCPIHDSCAVMGGKAQRLTRTPSCASHFEGLCHPTRSTATEKQIIAAVSVATPAMHRVPLFRPPSTLARATSRIGVHQPVVDGHQKKMDRTIAGPTARSQQSQQQHPRLSTPEHQFCRSQQPGRLSLHSTRTASSPSLRQTVESPATPRAPQASAGWD